MAASRRPSWQIPNLLSGRQPVTRRRFLEMLGAAGAGAIAAPLLADVAGSAPATGSERLPAGYLPTWPEGVASGDPHPTGTILWTRLTPPAGAEDLPVLWEVAADPDFATIAAGGTTTALAAHDHTVKVAVDSLTPDRWWWYRFIVGDTPSPTGRTRTAPSPGSTPQRLRFAYASCQQRTRSTYVAHKAIAAEPDLAFFMHQGDYIYAHDSASLSVQNYRDRWKLYTGNPLLAHLRASLPLVMVWDDGEFYNGVDRLGPPERLAAAKQVFFENMPLVGPPDDPTRTHRSLRWGRLADLLLLDTRSYRDPEVPQTDTSLPGGDERLREDRTHLGATQFAWLLDELAASTAMWRVLGSSVNMAPWRIQQGPEPFTGQYAAGDAWDDYIAERRRLLQFLEDGAITDNLVCSAHTHLFVASELQAHYDDPVSPTVGFDFTSASLTADPDVIESLMAEFGLNREQAIAGLKAIEAGSLERNAPFQRYLNLRFQGYAVAELTGVEAVIEYKTIDTYDPDAESWTAARFIVRRGENTMTAASWENPGEAPPYEAEVLPPEPDPEPDPDLDPDPDPGTGSEGPTPGVGDPPPVPAPDPLPVTSTAPSAQIVAALGPGLSGSASTTTASPPAARPTTATPRFTG